MEKKETGGGGRRVEVINYFKIVASPETFYLLLPLKLKLGDVGWPQLFRISRAKLCVPRIINYKGLDFQR